MTVHSWYGVKSAKWQALSCDCVTVCQCDCVSCASVCLCVMWVCAVFWYCALVCEYGGIRSGHETYAIINPALCVEIAHSDSEVEVSNDYKDMELLHQNFYSLQAKQFLATDVQTCQAINNVDRRSHFVNYLCLIQASCEF